MTALVAGLLAACNSDDSNSSGNNGGTLPPPTSTEAGARGAVIDGYVRGATVCVDANTNNLCDEAEAKVQSALSGLYQLRTTSTSGPLIALGGINSDTGATNTMMLRAPPACSVPAWKPPARSRHCRPW